MNAQDFGERVRELRTRRELTQTQLGKAAGLSGDTISRIERACFYPTLESMEKIAKAFSLPLVAILHERLDLPEDLALLIRDLSPRDQQVAFAVVGILRVQQTLDG